MMTTLHTWLLAVLSALMILGCFLIALQADRVAMRLRKRQSEGMTPP